MTDQEIMIARQVELLRRMSPRLNMLDCENVLTAADLIEELEAKLAKAMEALKAIYREYDPSEDGQNAATMYGISCEALAELEK